MLTRADKDKTGFLTGEDLYGEFSRAFSAQNKGGRGPFGYKPRELEQSLLLFLLDEFMAKSVAE